MRRVAPCLYLFCIIAAQAQAQAQAQAAQTAPPGAYLLQDGSLRPIPDPTLLTTQSQEKAIAGLRELIDARISAIEKELILQAKNLAFQETRANARLDLIPSLIKEQVTDLQVLMIEKFKGVDQQFQGRDTALAAALLAQKTSVDEQNKANAASAAKQEAGIAKQIDGITSIIMANSQGTDGKIDAIKNIIQAQTKALDDKIVDLRATINDVRSIATATTSRGAGQSDLIGWIVGALGAFVALGALIMSRTQHARV